jgi:hypothetical protein
LPGFIVGIKINDNYLFLICLKGFEEWKVVWENSTGKLEALALQKMTELI